MLPSCGKYSHPSQAYIQKNSKAQFKEQFKINQQYSIYN